MVLTVEFTLYSEGGVRVQLSCNAFTHLPLSNYFRWPVEEQRRIERHLNHYYEPLTATWAAQALHARLSLVSEELHRCLPRHNGEWVRNYRHHMLTVLQQYEGEL